MDLQDCVDFANANPLCYVATTEGDQPRVRAFLMWFADENGFYFSTLSPKQVYMQLKANPKVELCFYNNPADRKDAKMMRVTGEVEFLDDQELVKKVREERPGTEKIVGKPLRHLTEILRVHSGEAHFWTMLDILKESELERIKF